MFEKHILNDPRFVLLYGISQRFGTDILAQHLRLNRESFTLHEGCTKNALVYPYQLLATHPSPFRGDLFSPMYGKITDIDSRSIYIEAIEPDADLQAKGAEAKKPQDLFTFPERGEALGLRLKKMGLNTLSLGQICETLVINGLNPDPGVGWAEPMLMCHYDTIAAGLGMLRLLSPAKKILLAIPQHLPFRSPDIETVPVPERYPSSLNPLVIKAVTGKEGPEGVGIVGLHNIWSLGRVVQTGLPLIETVLTIGSLYVSGNYVVQDGSYIGDLLHNAGMALQDGDTVVRGGPLRGESLDRLDRSVTKGSIGIFIIRAGEIPPMEGHAPCINCGACVQVCPSRLNPAALSRFAEFALHERNLQEYIQCCMECGLCGYVCMVRRPVLQYIRLSKMKLGLDAKTLRRKALARGRIQAEPQEEQS